MTGRGTPIATKLIPDLVRLRCGHAGCDRLRARLGACAAGGIFGTVVEAEIAKGKVSFGFTGTATHLTDVRPGGLQHRPGHRAGHRTAWG